MADNKCYQCENRTSECHALCGDYKKFVADYERIRKIRLAEREINSAHFDNKSLAKRNTNIKLCRKSSTRGD